MENSPLGSWTLYLLGDSQSSKTTFFQTAQRKLESKDDSGDSCESGQSQRQGRTAGRKGDPGERERWPRAGSLAPHPPLGDASCLLTLACEVPKTQENISFPLFPCVSGPRAVTHPQRAGAGQELEWLTSPSRKVVCWARIN